MTMIRISLFGKFNLQAGERQIVAFESRKVDELFCYLLLHRAKPHPREVLADLLWEENTTSQSKNYLRKAIWQLQTALEELVCPEDKRLILTDGDWVQIHPEIDLWLDVSELEAAFQDSRGILGRDLDHRSIRAIQQAVALYRGDLLEGWFPDWCLYERERLQLIYLALLHWSQVKRTEILSMTSFLCSKPLILAIMLALRPALKMKQTNSCRRYIVLCPVSLAEGSKITRNRLKNALDNPIEPLTCR